MQIPFKQVVLRMRLMRARALLVESALVVTSEAKASSATSISRFYHHFKIACGTSPNAVITQYLI